VFVIDLSSLDASNKHGDKIQELSSNIENWTNSLLEEYSVLKNESDEYSDEIISIINNLLNSGIDNEGLTSLSEDASYTDVIEELRNMLKDGSSKLGLTDKENIQIAILQITNRVDEINDRSAKREVIKGKLETLNSEINKINGLGINSPEDDADQETEVELDNYRNVEDDEIVIPEGEVENIHPSSDELIAQVEALDEEPTEEEPFEFEFDSDGDKNDELLSDIEEYESNEENSTDDEEDDESGFEIEIEDEEPVESETEVDEDEQNVSDYFDNVDEQTEDEEDSYKTFTLGKSVSLVDISQRVYGESDYWKDLYQYDTNKEIIDTIADACGVSAEDICTKKGKLNGVTLKFPLELVTYESEENE